MPTNRVADVLIDTLKAAGVHRLYGVAGDSLNAITDSIRPRTDFSWVHVRHEEAAAFAAGAEAQLTGSLAACAGSCGPGNTHLINGLFDAHRSRAPVVAIAAQIPSREIGTGYFQETHPELLFRECSHFCELISHPSQMPRVAEIAVQVAQSRGGVSVIVLPGDIALLPVAETPAHPTRQSSRSTLRPSDDALADLAARLNSARKVTILAGWGCAGAHDEVIALAAKLKAPIVHTMRGKEWVEYDNPFDVGMTGLLGYASGYRAMMACDTLLMLGTDFPYRQFYPQEATILQVDLRGEQIGRRTPVALGLVGDVRTTITAVLPLLKGNPEEGHLRDSVANYKKSREGLDELAEGTPGRPPIRPQHVARVLNELAAADAIFACDVGSPTVWTARYIAFNGKRRLLGSFVHGSMANALPQAIGAQAAFPERQVIALSGDGGIAMLLGDLLTLRQHNLPVKVVVFNNASLNFVRLEMETAGFLPFGVDLVNPDFAALAGSAGITGLKATDPEQVEPMVGQLLGQAGPALLEVVVNPQELIMPPTLDLDEVKGFGLYLVKAVLNGRGDEVLDLARTKWLR